MAIQGICRSTGRRGQVLIAVGIGWMGMGWSVLFDHAILNDDAAILFELIANPTRARFWIATGLVAAIAGCRREWQWLGFALATLMPVQRAISYLWSSIMWVVPGAPGGHLRSFGAGLFWTALVMLLWLVSTWTDEDNRVAK